MARNNPTTVFYAVGLVNSYRYKTLEVKLKSEMNQSKYLLIEEAASYLRIPVKTIYQLTRAGKLRHFKPGRRLLFLLEDLDIYVTSGLVNATDRTISQVQS
jgi:excisionase family DNA binding protein